VVSPIRYQIEFKPTNIYGKQTKSQCGCVVVWHGASLVRPSALRSGPLGFFAATHDVSVSPQSRHEVTKIKQKGRTANDAPGL